MTTLIALVVVAGMLLLPMFVHMSYCYVMAFKYARSNGKIPGPARWFFYPTALAMLPGYVLMNWTIGNIVFLELNFHPQFTQRCNRHLMGRDGWRKRQAQFWCRNFLDPFDPAGGHCGPPEWRP